MIPQGLEQYPQFILCNDKKIPLNPHTLQVCDAHDPRNWCTAEQAITLSALTGYRIGYVITTQDPFFACDLDKCIEPNGTISPLAQTFLQAFPGCYREISVSGTGFHIFGIAGPQEHSCKNTTYNIELYTSGRYIALTGTSSSGSALCDPGLNYKWLVDNYFPPGPTGPAVEWTDKPVPEYTGPTDDTVLIEKMLRSRSAANTWADGVPITDLWENNIPVLAARWPSSDPKKTHDASSADASLLIRLAWWTGKNCERMQRIFGMSALSKRDKWQNRQDYRQRTILNAVAKCTEVYNAGGVPEPTGTIVADPILFDDPELPRITREMFPGVLGNMIFEVAKTSETPAELPAMLGIAAVATACQKKFSVSPEKKYFEPLCIWTIAALPSGNRKSFVQKSMSDPLYEWEKSRGEEVKKNIAAAITQQKNQAARIKSLRSKYAKPATSPHDLPAIESEIKDLEANEIQIPLMPQIWAQDITPENLGTVMADHGQKMSILSSEGGIFDIIAGRYNNNIPNLDLFLQAHSGDPVRVNRGSRDEVLMGHPLLTMGLSPQPEVLRGLASGKGFRGRGLLARPLYMLPPSPLGHRTLQAEPINEFLRDDYSMMLTELLNIPQPEDNPQVITLSSGAYSVWKSFQMEVEIELRPGGKFEHIKDWGSKLPGAAARIAGLFHCVEKRAAGEISTEVMTMALYLAAVLSDHAVAVFGLIGTDSETEKAKKVWKWIERNRKPVFSRRDCHQGVKGTIHNSDAMDAPLKILEGRYYIQAIPAQIKVGRPSQEYQVNPKLTVGW